MYTFRNLLSFMTEAVERGELTDFVDVTNSLGTLRYHYQVNSCGKEFTVFASSFDPDFYPEFYNPDCGEMGMQLPVLKFRYDEAVRETINQCAVSPKGYVDWDNVYEHSLDTEITGRIVWDTDELDSIHVKVREKFLDEGFQIILGKYSETGAGQRRDEFMHITMREILETIIMNVSEGEHRIPDMFYTDTTIGFTLVKEVIVSHPDIYFFMRLRSDEPGVELVARGLASSQIPFNSRKDIRELSITGGLSECGYRLQRQLTNQYDPAMTNYDALAFMLSRNPELCTSVVDCVRYALAAWHDKQKWEVTGDSCFVTVEEDSSMEPEDDGDEELDTTVIGDGFVDTGFPSVSQILDSEEDETNDSCGIEEAWIPIEVIGNTGDGFIATMSCSDHDAIVEFTEKKSIPKSPPAGNGDSSLSKRTCEVCGKICKSPSGLAQHKKNGKCGTQ